VVERAESEVVVELGVPLGGVSLYQLRRERRWTYGASVGVSGLDGGSGRSISVGVFILMVLDLSCCRVQDLFV